ncbi:metalloregulator ArsR/SmtB family transcription factor [Methanogenium marinum]|uniref:Metalloregulator ArsR/SmtB family transcription factor n=1 Tax=Methanogenium marinum TaxID=348610 RepID=A0A9Q4KTX1_9EURY|nr:metalloregulator ArsR/SmtB family transcription factor [Methanogenium marinum]MDE4908564.1 metalloregulator ArsR/SmtB family transcription factor [Methanogenium marinum]
MKPSCCSEIPAEALETIGGKGGLEGLLAALPDDMSIVRVRTFHHACADVYRIKILELLRVQPLCACIIRETLGITKSKLSYHLKILQEAGMISGTAKGTWIVYGLTESGEFCSSMNAKVVEGSGNGGRNG